MVAWLLNFTSQWTQNRLFWRPYSQLFIYVHSKADASLTYLAHHWARVMVSQSSRSQLTQVEPSQKIWRKSSRLIESGTNCHGSIVLLTQLILGSTVYIHAEIKWLKLSTFNSYQHLPAARMPVVAVQLPNWNWRFDSCSGRFTTITCLSYRQSVIWSSNAMKLQQILYVALCVIWIVK